MLRDHCLMLAHPLHCLGAADEHTLAGDAGHLCVRLPLPAVRAVRKGGTALDKAPIAACEALLSVKQKPSWVQFTN